MASPRETLELEPRFYTWSFPGSPVRVRLDLALVGRLGEHLNGASRGLLLGRSVDPGTTEITGFYPLSDAGMVAAIAASEVANPGLSVVGYYRTHQEPGLHLTEGDLTLARTFFPDPHSVVLLIHPAVGALASASFFFWDGGHMNGDFPFLEFPFDVKLLAAEERQRLATSKQRQLTLTQSTAGPTRRTVNCLKRFAWVPVVALVLAAAAAGGRWYLAKQSTALSDLASASREATRTASTAIMTFSLAAERHGADLKLSWDRSSPVILNAAGGVLFLVEGEAKREIRLEADQLRSGSILYSPTADQIRIELTVLAADGRAEKESVLVILPRTGSPRVRVVAPILRSSKQEQPSEPTAKAQPLSLPSAPPPSDGLTGLPQTAESASRVPAPPLSSQATEPPLPAPVASRLAPLVAVASTSADSPKPTVALPTRSEPTVPAMPTPGTSVTYLPPVPVRQVAPAVPAFLKPFMVSTITVQVTVSIDEKGRVVKAVPLPQKGANALLVSTAVNTARAWRFRPARRGDVPIPSERTLQFVFNRQR